MSSPSDDRPRSTGSAPRAVRSGLGVHLAVAVAVTAVVAAVWGLLAGFRPTVTWHLAPVIAVVAGPYAAWSRGRGWSPAAAVVTAVGAGVVTATATAVLAGAGWLAGPTWVGADAAAEAHLFTGVTTAVVLAVGVAAAVRSDRGPGHASPADDRD